MIVSSTFGPYRFDAVTAGRLERFAQLVRKWNRGINLIARSTEDDLETRHLADSAALWSHVPASARNLADLGTGAGFPGLVLAILAEAQRPGLLVNLVECDARKAAFLQAVERELGLGNIAVHVARIEDLAPLGADVVTARALAPLAVLANLVRPHVRPDGLCLFPKGRRWKEEVEAAQSIFRFQLTVHPSAVSEESVILQVEGLECV